MGDPRKANLSLPADYIDKPAGKVRSWLNSNTQSIRMLDQRTIVGRLRNALGPQITALNDGDLAAMIDEWAKGNGASVSPIPQRIGPGEPEIVAQVKKVFAAIPTSIKVNLNNFGGEISVSGAMASFRRGPVTTSIARGWSGNLEFKTQVSGVAFAAALAGNDWRMSLTFGQAAPDLNSLENVFRKGEAAMRGALSSIDKLSPSNPGRAKQILAPYVDPIKSAVTAAAQSARLSAGGVNVGAWTGSSPAGGIAAGIQLTIVF